jgi:hypothetical protein
MSARRPHPVLERHSEQRCSGAVRYAAAYPRPPVAAQFESAEWLQAVVLRRRAAAVPVPVHFFAETVPAHFFAEAAAQARRSAEPEVLAGRAVARLPEESAARDVVAVPPRVAGHAGVAAEAALDAAEAPRPEAAAWVAAAVPRLEAAAARGAAGVLQQGAAVQAGAVVLQPAAAAVQAGVAVRPPEARDAAAVLRPAAPGARAAGRPLVVPLVFRRDPALPWPAPSPAARFAHAMERLQIASP